MYVLERHKLPAAWRELQGNWQSGSTTMSRTLAQITSDTKIFHGTSPGIAVLHCGSHEPISEEEELQGMAQAPL